MQEGSVVGETPASAGRGGWRGLIGLLLIVLAVYVPGQWTIPVVDRDEARFAQASRQMLESLTLPRDQRDLRPIAPNDHGRLTGGLHAGGVVVPMLAERPRLNKPPMIYWLQAGSAFVLTGGKAERDAIWMYRVPSLVAGVVCVLLTWRLGVMMIGAMGGWLAGACIAVSPVFAWEGHQARADMVLVAVTLLGMMALWKVYVSGLGGGGNMATQSSGHGTQDLHGTRGRTLWWAVVFWVAMGLGILTKGPITPMVAALAVVTLCIVHRRVRWVLGLRPLVGIVIVAAMVGPWVWAVGERVGWDLYTNVVVDETLGRSVSAKEGHWGPPGYHALFVMVLLWPGSLAIVQGLVGGWRSVRMGEGGGLTFAMAWVVPSWAVFEIVGTKLPHYTMPLYPGLLMLALSVVVNMATQSRGHGTWAMGIGGHSRRVWRGVGLAVCAGPTVGLTALMVSDPSWRGEISWPAMTAGWVLAVLAVAMVMRGARRLTSVGPVATIRAGVIAGCIASVATIGLILPSARPVWVSDAIGRAIREADPAGARPVGMVSFHEDSLIYHTRGRIVRVNEDQMGQWWREHPDGMLVIPESLVLRSHGVLARASGVNYSRGQRADLALVTWWRPSPEDAGEPPSGQGGGTPATAVEPSP